MDRLERLARRWSRLDLHNTEFEHFTDDDWLKFVRFYGSDTTQNLIYDDAHGDRHATNDIREDRTNNSR